MYTPFLLALPLLAPVLGHTIPRNAHAHTNRAAVPVSPVEKNLIERTIPKAHLGFAPHNSDGLSGVAGFQKRDGMRKVRRRKSKRACTVPQDPTGVATSSIGGGLHASPSAYATVNATYAQPSAPAITSASAVYSDVPSSTSSAAPVESTSAGGSGSGGLGGLMGYVFPQGRGTADWTTVTDQADSMSCA